MKKNKSSVVTKVIIVAGILVLLTFFILVNLKVITV